MTNSAEAILEEIRGPGLRVPQLRALARRIGPNQPLAEQLWQTGLHDARILAALIGEPKVITRSIMDKWARDFDSWDVCDGCCCVLFDRSPHAWSRIAKWAPSRHEFVRRAAFSMIAAIAVHDKAAPDDIFIEALNLVEKYAFDDRNFVRKGVNWALRNIGKRNPRLCIEAIAAAERIRRQNTRAARWIAADAHRELRQRTRGFSRVFPSTNVKI
jgi:3-methyladenine DNA glycosylase AlkD